MPQRRTVLCAETQLVERRLKIRLARWACVARNPGRLIYHQDHRILVQDALGKVDVWRDAKSAHRRMGTLDRAIAVRL